MRETWSGTGEILSVSSGGGVDIRKSGVPWDPNCSPCCKKQKSRRIFSLGYSMGKALKIYQLKSLCFAGHWWLSPKILPTWLAEIGRILV
jgi:hypothetical protein